MATSMTTVLNAAVFGRSAMAPTQFLNGVTLRTLPLPLRVLFSCFLVTIGLGYLAAIYVEQMS